MATDELADTEAKASARSVRLLLIALAGLTLIRALCASSFGLIAAEAYYWTWSRQLAAGYFDHPPVIAFLIRLTTGLVGDSQLGVRLGPVVLGTVGPIAFYCLCRRLAGPRGAAWATGFLIVAPFFLPFGIAATPDSPLLFFWILSLWAFYAAYETGRPALWLAAGLATGLCILSKYNGLQLPICFFAFLVLTRRGRDYLRGPLPWMAMAVTAAVIAPNMLWDLQHSGGALATPGRASGSAGLRGSAGQIARFLSLIVIVPTPFVFAVWVRRTFSAVRLRQVLRDEHVLFCVMLSWFPLAGFGVLSFVKDIHAQWIAPCLIAALPLAAGAFLPDGRPIDRKLAKAGTWLAAVLVVGVLSLAAAVTWAPWRWVVRMPAPVVQAARRVRGYDQLARSVGRELDEHRDDRNLLLMSSGYHFTCLLDWLLRERDIRPTLPLMREKFNQFGLWYREGMYDGWDAILVNSARDRGSELSLRRAFEDVQRLPPVVIEEDGLPVRRFHIYYCRGFRGPI